MLKNEIISKFKTHESDTGSTEVQVALLTSRIEQISEHLKVHKKDFTAKRGLLILIAQRNGLLRYLARNDQTRYKSLCQKLEIRVKF